MKIVQIKESVQMNDGALNDRAVTEYADMNMN